MARRGTWGLRTCTLAVPAGRVVAVVGPNGAGKTTLLHLAAGLLPPTEGSVQVAGAVPERRLERIGFAPRTLHYGPSCASVTSSVSAPISTPRWDADLVVLAGGRVRLAGDIDKLRHAHRVIVGPAGWPTTMTAQMAPTVRDASGDATGKWELISAREAAGRTTALVRVGAHLVAGPGLQAVEPTFEELVLGYLDQDHSDQDHPQRDPTLQVETSV